jgi:peptidoglycan/LPS O-acetylase OafA/YrhL
VDLFFVLSGFLITGILCDTQKDPAYYRKFYARRALRIFPIYYLLAGIALLVVPWGAWHKGDMFFLVYLGYPAALIWPSLVSIPIRITHVWSLSVEEQFYAVWPWLIRRLGRPSHILCLCAAAAVVSLVLRIVFPNWAYASLPCRMDGLALGSAIAILFRMGLRNLCQRLALPVFAVSVIAVLLICGFRHTTVHADRVICTAGFSLIAIAYGALLILAVGPLSNLFSARALRRLGKYSYGMYLYHFPLTAAFEQSKPFFTRLPFGFFLYVGVCFVANLAIAILSFYLIEQPILNLRKRFEYAREGGDLGVPVQRGHAARFEPGSIPTENLGKANLGSPQ